MEALRVLAGMGAAAVDPFLFVPALAIGATRDAWRWAVLWAICGGIAYTVAVAAVFSQWSHPNIERIMVARGLAFAVLTLAGQGLRRLVRRGKA